VQNNHESRALQYALRERAIELGWSAESVAVVDEDLARSGSSTDGRLGFKDLVAEVGLGRVGLILGIEVSPGRADPGDRGLAARAKQRGLVSAA
jgi:hypothetical protein